MQVLPSHTVQELRHWSELELDFAIIGIDRCGTTSLYRNLARHPQISFTPSAEDPMLTFGKSASGQPAYTGDRRLLPLKSQVQEFNSLRTGKLHGLKNADIFHNALAREILTKIPGLKALLIGCDLASRFERIFFHSFCSLGTCRPTIEETICNRSTDSFWNETRLLTAPHLQTVSANFPLLVTHQEFIRRSPRESYQLLAQALGVAPFPENTKFVRIGGEPGMRTGLCRNTSLLSRLQWHLKDEYRALERIIDPRCREQVKCRRALRKTRCSRQEELRERSAGASEVFLHGYVFL